METEYPGLHNAAWIMRLQRKRDLLSAIAEWSHADGEDRAYWRRQGLYLLAEWKRLYRRGL